MDKIKISQYSEIGEIEAVVLHTPGPEVENMTPLNAERALYSDILNLSVVQKEYSQLNCVLSKLTTCYYVTDLLKDILELEGVKEELVRQVCGNECIHELLDELLGMESKQLAGQLIEGVPIRRDSLTGYMDPDNFSLGPLHNFFFTRDSSVALYDRILIPRMASKVRERESIISQAIFEHHPLFEAPVISAREKGTRDKGLHMEGGDIIIAREDILLVGLGERSSSKGIDFIIDHLKEKKDKRHVIVQELPSRPESFIHLDMVFTMLDKDKCMVYEPLILKPNRYETIHIALDNGNVSSISSVKNIPEVLKKLGMDIEPLYCGGRKDSVWQEREQWHSGANFFAAGPGKVIGYARNAHTIEELNSYGFEVLRAKDINSGKTDPAVYDKFVITIEGSELSRGGGGARCMTMPVNRKIVDW